MFSLFMNNGPSLFLKHVSWTSFPACTKKILFTYFKILEKYIYSSRRPTQYIVIANFLKNFLNDIFSTDLKKITLIPSGVNTDEFELQKVDTQTLFSDLLKKYPQLSGVNPQRPIALFVGAFERKGLYRVFDTLKTLPEAQLIVIGKSEFTNFEMPALPFKVVHIPFTKEVNLFYQLTDLFIFPTSYEPFGLVILEAYVMGLDLLIPSDNVGASEIIPQTVGISYFQQSDIMPVPALKKITLEDKKERRIERLKMIENYKWENSGEKFYSILNQSSR